MKFLIIDKSSEVRSSIRKIIYSAGNSHSTSEVSNFDDALFFLNSCLPDYVIMDVDSMNEKGMIILNESVSLLSAARIFVLTEFAENIYKDKLLKLGVEKVFAKSSDTNSFIEKLLAVINNKEIGYELYCSDQYDNIVI